MDNQVEAAKVSAARMLCDILASNVPRGSILGIGTGSTVKIFTDMCTEVLRQNTLVASSTDTALHLRQLRLHVTDVLSIDELDVYVDGADEVSTRLDMIKGHGGALFREKTLAYMAKTRIYIVDYTKYTGLDYLYAKPVPVEVVPFALTYFLKSAGRTGLYEPVVRFGTGKYGPVVTDNGNYIVDLKLREPIRDPLKAHLDLKTMHGVVETGIFPSEILVDTVIVGYPDKAIVLSRKERTGS